MVATSHRVELGAPEDLVLPVRRSLPVQVAGIVTEAVLAGAYPPGTTLPAERDLARQLGVNRTSLRQALARLEQAGLVASRQGIGTVVLDPLEASDSTIVLRALLAAGSAVVPEVLEVRQALASVAGRTAATRASAAQRYELAACFERATGCTSPATLQSAELSFFSALVSATGNRPLAVMMRWLERLYAAAAPVFVGAFADADAVIGGLRSILDAVAGADPDAAEQAVQAYASTSGERFLAAARRTSAVPVVSSRT